MGITKDKKTPTQPKAAPQAQDTYPNQQSESMPFSGDFPNPNESVKLPKRPIGAVIREQCLRFFRFIFSPECAVYVGYGIAISSMVSGAIGYYLVINSVSNPLGLDGFRLLGLNVIPLVLGLAASLTIQYKELEPRKHKIFPHLADRAAFKAGNEVMVNPAESKDKASMLPHYKYMARFGDSIRARDARKSSALCYVFESVGGLVAIGALLSSSNPLIQIGAVAWLVYSVFGCEYGLGHAEKANAECLTATQERDYRLEKDRLQAQAI